MKNEIACGGNTKRLASSVKKKEIFQRYTESEIHYNNRNILNLRLCVE